MKEKIFNALKTKYNYLGLGDDILLAHATTLEGMGLVTDENLQKVIDAQFDFLKTLQSSNDKRVTDALKSAKDKAEVELKSAVEKAQKEAKEKFEIEQRTKNEEETRKKAEEEKKKGEPEWKQQMDALLQAEREKSANDFKALQEQLKSIVDASAEQKKTLETLRSENEQMKTEKAKAERKAFIATTAKNLNIPEWRINEGFVIADDADNASITTYLSNVASNIKTAGLQSGGNGSVITNEKATAEEISALADSLLK